MIADSFEGCLAASFESGGQLGLKTNLCPLIYALIVLSELIVIVNLPSMEDSVGCSEDVEDFSFALPIGTKGRSIFITIIKPKYKFLFKTKGVTLIVLYKNNIEPIKKIINTQKLLNLAP